MICVGDGFTAYEKYFSAELKSKLIRKNSLNDFPNAGVLGQIAALDFDPITTFDWESLKPLYIRGSEAEEEWNADRSGRYRA